MKKGLIAILVVLILANCSSTFSAKNMQSQETLTGTWLRAEYYPSDVFFEEIEYLPDGRKCTFSQTHYTNGSKKSSFFESNWVLDDNKIIAEVKKSSSEYVPVGTKYTDEIETISNSYLQIQMTYPFYGDSKEIFYRSPYQRKGIICDLVESNTKIPHRE